MKNKGPWLFRVYIEDYTAQLDGDYFINHETRIPLLNNEDSMESKAVFFFRGSPGTDKNPINNER